MARRIDWDRLVAHLPARHQARFEELLRQSLKRSSATNDLGHMPVPESVRTQAVGTWRARYMQNASKMARHRANYDKLKNKPTYKAIELKLLARYLKRHPDAAGETAVDVDSLTLSQACEAYRQTMPKLGSSPLSVLLREIVREAYDSRPHAQLVRSEVEANLLAMAREDDLSQCAHVYGTDPNRPGRMRQRPFGLEGVASTDELVDVVGRSHLVDGMLAQLCGNSHQGRQLIAGAVLQDDALKPANALYARLFNTPNPARTDAERLAQREGRRLDAYFHGLEFVSLVAAALLKNPRYRAQYDRAIELRLRVRESVPTTPMEAYPLARSMTRRFVLHVGPTNSGKTHDALQELMAAKNGCYLGPLRLLAYEQYERMNAEGVPCSLLTGEESVEVAGAHHVASTVEMADFHHEVAVAVIDEAQMVADPDRGHNWTAAILGIPAQVVHVCLAPHAERVVCDLIMLCADEFEVVRHERLVPLRSDRGNYRIPSSVVPGDALIVFSRRMVHQVASEVMGHGLSASMIYGALPHDVRHEEARRFDEGETNVVVATDAIGMGMNLPIKRIVFVEQEKWDGHSLRMLRPEEVQQIAGRAGRFGRYDKGLYTSTRQRGDIVRLMSQSVPPIETIPVGIPDNIALVQGATLTSCIRQWMSLELREPFVRIGVDRTLALIGELEATLSEERRVSTEDKLKVLALASMPFDERERSLKEAWRAMAEAVLAGESLELPVPDSRGEEAHLAALEADYRFCDLLYCFERGFGSQERIDLLVERRREISSRIIKILASQ